ncbi:type IV pilus biogenesis protein PilP [Yersinia enterocolitica]
MLKKNSLFRYLPILTLIFISQCSFAQNSADIDKSASKEKNDMSEVNKSVTNPDENKKPQSIAKQLAAIKSDVVLINAEAQRAEAMNKLREATGTKKSDSSDEDVGLPMLKSIYGLQTQGLKAEFQFDSGAVINASSGTTLPGGFKVLSVSQSSLQLTDIKGKVYSLSVIHSRQQNDTNNYSHQSLGSIPTPRLR